MVSTLEQDAIDERHADHPFRRSPASTSTSDGVGDGSGAISGRRAGD